MYDDKPVVLGRISGLFGVRGWIKIHSFTEPREAILGYGNWRVGHEDDWKSAQLAEGKRHGKTVIARLEGIDDRDAASELTMLEYYEWIQEKKPGAPVM